MNKVSIFEHPEFGRIRTLEIDGKIWFCASDVAAALGYSNPRDAVVRHCKPMGVVVYDTPTRSAVQKIKYISEGNVYRLIAGSKLPSAEKFESWIFDELVPETLKNGGYLLKKNGETDNELLARAILLAQNRIKERDSRISALEKELLPDNEYDFDFDHQFIETEKFDAKITYKKFTGYSPGIATVGDVIVGIENRDGNTNVRFHQEDTLKRIFERLENARIHINRARMDCGSCSEAMVEMVEKHSRHFYIRANRCVSLYDDIFALRGWKTEYINGHEFEICSIIAEKWVGKAYRLVIQRQRSINKELDLWEGEYTYRCILTNDYTSTDRDIVEYYNKRGGAERVLDDMNNGFGWKRLPKSFMAENTVFLLLTALIRNFYRHLISDANMKSFGLKRTSRIKTFVFKYVSVPAKWIKTARQHILNIYTSNDAYMMAFKFDFG